MPKEIVEKEKTVEERMLDFQERQLAIQERQVAASEAALKLQGAQLAQTKRPSNARGPNISPMNPRGEKDYKMPRLKCEIMAPWKIDPQIHGLTREEVELFNLLEPGEYTVSLNDGSTRHVTVVATMNTVKGTIERLTLAGAYDPDAKQYGSLFIPQDKQLFPAMTTILRECISQQPGGTEKAAKVMTMREEKRRIALPAEDPAHLAVSVGA